MILAAGLGTRLAPITHTVPKCLVEVGGKAMLEHVVERLKASGVSSIVINTHYLPDRVERFVAERHNFGMQVTLSHEPAILGTGGGLRKVAAQFCNEKTFLMVNADIFHEFDLSLLVKAREEQDALAVLLTMDRREDSYLLFDGDNCLVGWERGDTIQSVVMNRKESAAHKNRQYQRRAFCGVQALSPRIFDFMPEEPRQFSIIDTYMEASKLEEKVTSYQLPQGIEWHDVGSMQKLEALRTLLQSR